MTTQLHLFWHSTDLPAHLGSVVKMWTTIMATATITIWTPNTVPHPVMDLYAASKHRVHVDDLRRHLANIARWHLLRDHGGVWVDTDITPLRPLDPLLGQRAFCASVGPTRHETAVIGGPPHHDLWDRLIAAINNETHTDRCPNVSGAKLLRRIVEPDEITVHEPGRFFHRDAAGTFIDLPADGLRYTTHAWTTSTQRALVLGAT